MEENTLITNKTKLVEFVKKRMMLFVVLGVTLLILILGSVLFYIKNANIKEMARSTTKNEAPLTATEGDVQIILAPTEISINDTTPLTIDVLVNAKEFVNEVSIDLLFDPRIIGQFSIKSVKDPNSALSTSFEEIRNYVDVTSGNATFTVRIPNTYSEQKGMAKVARITMTPIGITANGTILTVSTSSKATSKTIGPSLTVGTSTLKNVN